MKYLWVLPIFVFLGGCLPSKINPLNQNITSKPYDGVTNLSYGEFNKNKIKYCSDKYNGDPLEAALHDVGKDVIASIYKPISGATVYDDTLIKEELQDQFRSIGNIVAANVVVLKRDKKEISFWYNYDEVSESEIYNAANKYCSYHKEKAIYLGAARRCGQPVTVPSIVTINGSSKTTTYTPTYAIAGFLCQ